MPVRHASLLSFALLVGLAQPAGAQTLYKSTMPDGSVIYGDKPVPGAAKSEAQKPDTSKQGIVPPKAPVKAAKKAEVDPREQRILAAEKALKDAEAAQAAGKEPTAGDRQGTVSGKQRLTEEYWARQKRLQDAVDQSRAYLEKLRAGK